MVLVLGKVTNIYINQIHNFFSLFIQLKIGLLFYIYVGSHFENKPRMTFLYFLYLITYIT
jgi:hypothetical protein